MKLLVSLLTFAALVFLPVAGYAQDATPTPVYRYAGVPANGTDELNTITIGGTPTAGTFTITVDGSRTTAPITWSATDATLVARVDAALEALSIIGTGGVTTADSTLSSGIGDLTVTLVGKNAKQDFPAMTVTSSLTGTSPTLAIANTTPGVAATFREAKNGDLVEDSTNGDLYQNKSSTALSPLWVEIASTSSPTLTTPTITSPEENVAVNTYASDGAVTVARQIALLTKTSAGAYTLAAPGAGGIGKEITLTTGTDFAHVVTFTGGTLWDGTATANTTWTAAAVQGSSLTVVGISATKWNVKSFNLGTIAP